jgi:hypothetical protein
MEETENKELDRDEIFSSAVRAGKRTYFFDVKETIQKERYLTITESKRRFNNEQGKFFYEKHKLFLYKEDFEKFLNGLSEAIEFIHTGKAPVRPADENETIAEPVRDKKAGSTHTDISFEDLKSDEDEN